MTSLRRLQRPIGLLLKGLIPVAALFFLALGMSSPAWATTFYVSTAGNDAYTGLSSSFVSGTNGPFRTLQRAAYAVRPGDTVEIRGGIYQAYSSWMTDGTASGLITITNYGGETVIIDGNRHAIPSSRDGILLQIFGDWYAVKNLEVRYSGGTGVAVHGYHCTVDNVTSHHNWGAGIFITGWYGLINNCRAHNNSLMNEYGAMTASWSFGISACRYPQHTTIRGCTAWENWGEGISTFEGYYNTIEDCVSYNNMCNFYISDSKYALFQRNLAYSTPGNLVQAYCTQNNISVGDEKFNPASSDNTFINNLSMGGERNFAISASCFNNTLVAHNTFVNASNTIAPTEAASVYFFAGTATNARFLNNIIVQDAPESSVMISHLETRGITFGHNCWSRPPVAGSRGTGDVTGDPGLLKSGPAAAGQLTPSWFKIQETSSARDKATVLSEVREDFSKNLRGSTPDIGAFNFSNETSTLSASATGTPLAGTNPLTVNFSGNASGGTPPYTYEWKFGDGFTATSQNASHIYSAVGRYTATLVVFDGAGTSASDDIGVTVDSIADITALPVASVGASALTGTAPLSVNFSGSASGGTSPYTFSWSFGDGGTSTEQNPSHIYVKAGTFTAKFTVADSTGKKGSGSATVIVASASTAAPTANFIAFPASGPAPHAVRFAGMASGGSSPYVYRWNFGDGTTSTERNPAHTYTLPGTYTVTLTVTDGRSMSTVKTMTVRITQAAAARSTTGGATGKLRTRLGLPARNPIFR